MNIPTLNKLAKELDKVNPTIDHALILKTHRFKYCTGKYNATVKEHSFTSFPGKMVWYETRSDRDGSYYQLFTVHKNDFTKQTVKDALQIQRDLLKKEARESYDFRGHKEAEWKNQNYHTAILECSCGKYVQVNSKPQANQINIGGDAVALDCND